MIPFIAGRGPSGRNSEKRSVPEISIDLVYLFLCVSVFHYSSLFHVQGQ